MFCSDFFPFSFFNNTVTRIILIYYFPTGTIPFPNLIAQRIIFIINFPGIRFLFPNQSGKIIIFPEVFISSSIFFIGTAVIIIISKRQNCSVWVSNKYRHFLLIIVINSFSIFILNNNFMTIIQIFQRTDILISKCLTNSSPPAVIYIDQICTSNGIGCCYQLSFI